MKAFVAQKSRINTAATGSINDDLSSDKMDGSTYGEGTHTAYLYIDLDSNLGNDWSKMTVKMPIKVYVNGSTDDYLVKTMEFTFENK